MLSFGLKIMAKRHLRWKLTPKIQTKPTIAQARPASRKRITIIWLHLFIAGLSRVSGDWAASNW